MNNDKIIKNSRRSPTTGSQVSGEVGYRCITPESNLETCKLCNCTNPENDLRWAPFQSLKRFGFLFLVIHFVSAIFDTIHENFFHVCYVRESQHRFAQGSKSAKAGSGHSVIMRSQCGHLAFSLASNFIVTVFVLDIEAVQNKIIHL